MPSAVVVALWVKLFLKNKQHVSIINFPSAVFSSSYFLTWSSYQSNCCVLLLSHSHSQSCHNIVTKFTIRFAQSHICPSLSIFSFIESSLHVQARAFEKLWAIAQLPKLKSVHLATDEKAPERKNLPSSSQNLVTYYSVGRREKSFRYNSEGRKNGKLIFLFFLQLKIRHLCSIRIFKNLLIYVSWFLSEKSYLRVYLIKLVVLKVS